VTVNSEKPVDDRRNRIFRDEAIEASVNRFGPPIRIYGLASWLLTAFIVSVAAAALIFVCVARYSRKETVVGSLVPQSGAQSLVALQSGTVQAISVRQGGLVQAGAPILTIVNDPLAASGQSVNTLRRGASELAGRAIAEQSDAALNVLTSQIQELDRRQQGVSAELAQLQPDHEIAEERLGLAQESVTAAQTLFDRGLMAATQMRQRQEALLVARQQQSSLRRDEARMRSELSQFAAQRRRLLAERDQIAATNLQRSAEYEEQRAVSLAREGQLITAQLDGRLAALHVRAGASVQAGQTLGVVLPRGAALEAEIWIPSRAVGFLKRGTKVRLLFDAYPYQRFGAYRGRIVHLSDLPTNPQDVAELSGATEPMYRATVALDRQSISANGRAVPLTPGMRLTADIILDERPLIVWLLDPILSAHMRGRSA
jgi:membrane fusion protein